MGVLDRFRLDGKRLFVTGGSRGLGREMALAIADAGADVVLVGRDLASLEKTAADIRALGRNAWTIQGDAGVPTECERICRTALDDFGPIDILINNVGGRRVNVPTQDMPLDTWRQMLDLNLTSTFLCTKLIGGAMVIRGKGGRIINLASINALVANRGIAGRHYETAKAAVLQFTRATAADWAALGITVNAILPGGFLTEANLRWAREAPAIIETFKAQIPMGALGKPEDLGPLAVYLASDASRYMTGAALIIDGGYTLWEPATEGTMAGASACFFGRDPAGVPARVSKMAGAFCDDLACQVTLRADPSIETSGPESQRSRGHVFQKITWWTKVVSNHRPPACTARRRRREWVKSHTSQGVSDGHLGLR